MQPVDVSVIVRTKDRPLLLPRAIRSLAEQTYKSFEVKFINDGGCESEVIAYLRDVKFQHEVITNPSSVGRGEALNVGVRRSTGEFLAIHDDDDRWSPQFLEKMMSAYREASTNLPFKLVGMVGDLIRIEEEISQRAVIKIKERTPIAENASKGLVNFFRYLAIEEDFFPIQAIFKRDETIKAGLFNNAFNVLEDREFFIRLLGRGELLRVKGATAYHHIRRKSDASCAHSNIVINRDEMDVYETLLDNLAFRGEHFSSHTNIADTLKLSTLAKDVFAVKQYFRKSQHLQNRRRISQRIRKWKDIFVRIITRLIEQVKATSSR